MDDGGWVWLSSDLAIQAATRPSQSVQEDGVETWNIRGDRSFETVIKELPLVLVGLFDPKSSNNTQPARTIWCPVTEKNVTRNEPVAKILLIQFRYAAVEKDYHRQYRFGSESLTPLLSYDSITAIKSLRRYQLDNKFQSAVNMAFCIDN
jgi:hypothetical protein